MLSIYTNKWNRTGLGSMVPGVVVPITVSIKPFVLVAVMFIKMVRGAPLVAIFVEISAPLWLVLFFLERIVPISAVVEAIIVVMELFHLLVATSIHFICCFEGTLALISSFLKHLSRKGAVSSVPRRNRCTITTM